MFKLVKYPNQVWLADFAILTRRLTYSVGGQTKRFNSNYIPSKHGSDYTRKKNMPYFPKWSKYVLRLASYQPDKRIVTIPFYKKPIALFAVFDAYSRLIIHGHLLEVPEYSAGFVWKYFPLEECCFPESLAVSKRLSGSLHSNPSVFIVDWEINNHYRIVFDRLNFAKNYLPSKHDNLLSPLERFFYTTEYEMRTGLNKNELRNWLLHYNFRRRSRSLNGLTPIEKYLNLIPPKSILDEWREALRNKQLQYQLQYYRSHKEARIAYQLNYYHKHRKKLIAYQLKRYHKQSH